MGANGDLHQPPRNLSTKSNSSKANGLTKESKCHLLPAGEFAQTEMAQRFFQVKGSTDRSDNKSEESIVSDGSLPEYDLPRWMMPGSPQRRMNFLGRMTVTTRSTSEQANANKIVEPSTDVDADVAGWVEGGARAGKAGGTPPKE
ncbi:unnamed protein product, partial [Ectocarpus sp. 6 AP-2014]